MSKLEDKYNDPVDNALSKLYAPIIPFLRNAGVTPNMITTLSMVSGLYSAKLIMDKEPRKAAFFFLLNYIFDCMDGYMARKYKMESKFGDWYDHVTDWITMAAILVTLIKVNKYSFKSSWFYVLMFLMILVNSSQWLGCQEKIYNNDIGGSIAFFKKWCKNPKTELLYKRYLGLGMLMIYVFLIIFFSKGKDK